MNRSRQGIVLSWRGESAVADLRSVGLDDSLALEQSAIHARQSGSFEVAAELFCRASQAEEDLRKELDLQIRQACCLLAIERHEDAAALAVIVANRARAEGYLAELVDAPDAPLGRDTAELLMAELGAQVVEERQRGD